MAEDKWIKGGGGSGKGKGSGSSGIGPSSKGMLSSGKSSDKSGNSGSSASSSSDKISSGEGSSSKKNFYKELDVILKRIFKEEWNDWDGTKPKKWFTDRFDKEKYSEIFDEFLAGPHDDEWQRLVQDDHGSLSEIAIHARAAGYMDSMWRDLRQLYEEDEINVMSEERNAIGKWLYQEPEILEFLTPRGK